MISIEAQTIRNKLEKQGFAVIPFPVKLLDAMRQHIVVHLSKVLGREVGMWESIEELSVACANLKREAFEANIGNQAFRIYPAEVSRLIREELKPQLCHLFEVDEIDLLKALPKHYEDNPSIGRDAYFCYWRFISPGQKEATPAHADSHFNQIHEDDDELLESSIGVEKMWKLWIPLFNCTPQNSLQVVPGTHHEDIPWSKVLVNGVHKPQIDGDWLEQREKEFICPIGNANNEALLFSEDLVHRGPANKGMLPRISSDFEVVLSVNKKF